MKKYRTKIALIAALALLLTAAIPALAATTTKITGAYEEPDIQVLIPTAGQAVINPFGLAVKVTADEPDEDNPLPKLKTGNQVATRPLVGVNLGDVALKIGAKVSAEARGDFRFSTAPIKGTDKTKSGMVYFQLKNPTEIDSSYVLTCDVDTTDPAVKTLNVSNATVCNGIVYAGVKTALEGWDSAYVKTDDLLLGAASVEKLEMATIAAVDQTTEEPQCTTGTDSYFLARVAGEVVTLPTEDWRTSDGFNATITWVIQPVG